MNEEQIQQQQENELEQMSHYGACPNCGATCKDDELGNEGGQICCKFCYEDYRKKQEDLVKFTPEQDLSTPPSLI